MAEALKLTVTVEVVTPVLFQKGENR